MNPSIVISTWNDEESSRRPRIQGEGGNTSEKAARGSDGVTKVITGITQLEAFGFGGTHRKRTRREPIKRFMANAPSKGGTDKPGKSRTKKEGEEERSKSFQASKRRAMRIEKTPAWHRLFL